MAAAAQLDDIASGDLWQPGDSADEPAAPVEGGAGGPAVQGADVTGAESTATPADVSDDDAQDSHPVPRKALIDERKKRQEHEAALRERERELAELRGRLAAFEQLGQRQQPAVETNPDDEFFDKGPAAYVEGRIGRETRALRYEMGADYVRAQHPDFDQAEQTFMQLVKDDPALRARFMEERNPARFVYDYVKAHERIKNIGSIDDLESRLREQIRTELEEEIRKKQAEAVAAQASTSSAGARGVSVTTPAAESVDDLDFDDILKGINNRF